MNPPYTRPTGQDGETVGIPVPSFAGFATSEEEQRAMSVQLSRIRTELKRNYQRTITQPYLISPPAGHGNAGLASNFIDLAHAKLRPGGVMALVLPAAFTQGDAWKSARELLSREYKDVLIVGISTRQAFSADTDPAEILLVATRHNNPVPDPDPTGVAVSLRRRPTSQLEGSMIARAISAFTHTTGPLTLGTDTHVGSCFIGSLDTVFKSSDIISLNLIGFMVNLGKGLLTLPQTNEQVKIPITRLAELGNRGLYHMDISGTTTGKNGLPRGPFDIFPLTEDDYPEYPVLWSHDAKRETRLVVAPDSKGLVRQNCQDKAVEKWRETASRLLYNRDFTMGSQPLAACLTDYPTIGGRAWPNFVVPDENWQIPLLLWANSTLGLMTFWWLGTRQQPGRSIISISRLPLMNTLDARCLTDEQIQACNALFMDFQDRSFLPAIEAFRDETRQQLDQFLLVDVLGLDKEILTGIEILREQWCREPSVHGGKSTRAQGL